MESREEADGWLVHDGTVDYKGRKADKRHTGGWKAAPLIFGSLLISCSTDSAEMFQKISQDPAVVCSDREASELVLDLFVEQHLDTHDFHECILTI